MLKDPGLNAPKCYHKYTCCLNVSDDADVSSTTLEDKGDFEKVKAFTRETILGLNKAVFVSAVQEIYGTGLDMSVKEATGLN